MLLTTLIFFIVLSVLVLVHELGHFLAAKRAGIKIEEFGFGYPPRLWAKKIRGTEYSINAVPFGGFVRLYGEESHFAKASRDAFTSKSKKARTAVILAGVLANFLLAIVCFSVVYSLTGIPKKGEQIRVVGLAAGSPAEKAGLKTGDLILEVDGKKLTELAEFTELIKEKSDRETKILISREGNNLLYSVTPRASPPEGEGPLGVAVTDVKIVKYPFWQMPILGAIEGTKEALGWLMLIAASFKKMILELLLAGVIPKDVAGPIGIFQVTAGVAKSGVLTVLQFIGVLSVNLAVINVLPLPALDGGKLLFIGYELLARRKPKPKVERWINTAGMAFIILLIILITVNDIFRLIQNR